MSEMAQPGPPVTETDVETEFAELEVDAPLVGIVMGSKSDMDTMQKAAKEHGVVAPLLEAGMGKAEIRELARVAGLRLWDKPASACLSSRIEYGRPVTREALAAVEGAEDILRGLGLRVFRVRHHGDIARIEVAREEIQALFAPGAVERVTTEFKALGFKYVTVDLEGYRSGSMNAVLPISELVAAGGKQ